MIKFLDVIKMNLNIIIFLLINNYKLTMEKLFTSIKNVNYSLQDENKTTILNYINENINFNKTETLLYIINEITQKEYFILDVLNIIYILNNFDIINYDDCDKIKIYKLCEKYILKNDDDNDLIKNINELILYIFKVLFKIEEFNYFYDYNTLIENFKLIINCNIKFLTINVYLFFIDKYNNEETHLEYDDNEDNEYKIMWSCLKKYTNYYNFNHKMTFPNLKIIDENINNQNQILNYIHYKCFGEINNLHNSIYNSYCVKINSKSNYLIDGIFGNMYYFEKQLKKYITNNQIAFNNIEYNYNNNHINLNRIVSN